MSSRNKLWGFMPGQESWANDEGFKPLSGSPLDYKTAAKVRAFIIAEITAVMSWYINCPLPGPDVVVDCPETRRNINADLDKILPKAAEKFGLKPIPMYLRVRSSEKPGWLIVRAEPKNLQ